MKIPSDIAIKSVLYKGAVFLFSEETFESDLPHFFVVLNPLPLEDPLIFLVNATSQVENRLLAAQRRGLSLGTIVIVEAGECDFITKRSAFDCNSFIYRPVKSLIEKFEQGNLRLIGKMSDSLVLKLINGLSSSRMIARDVKNILKIWYP